MSSKLQKFKKSFSRQAPLIHLNNAGLAPTSTPAFETVQYWNQRFHLEGMHCDRDYMQAAEVARAQLASLAGAAADEVAFFQSTAGAISQVAFGMGLQANDEVLVWDQEYGSNLYPWKAACDRSGAKLVRVESGGDLSTPIERLLARVTDRTRAIAISWVQFQTGAITDLQALAEFAKTARGHGIWTVIDVIQGFGMLPFDFANLGFDAVCGGSHKWLVSPVGVGFLILKKNRWAELRPLTVGSSTFGTCDDPADLGCVPKASALRFESGSKQVLEITALGASCQLISDTGVAVIQAEAFRLSERLREGLRSRGYRIHQPAEFQQAFVNFSGADLQPTVEFLKQHRVSFALRGPGIRLSTHAFNSDDDIDFVLSLL